MKRPEPYLQHILTEMEYLLRQSESTDFERYLRDETLRRSFERSLEIIGEAAKNIPKPFRDANAGVPWREMAGLRDVLIHQYFGVDHRRIWDIVKHKIPPLRDKVRSILADCGLDL